MVPRFTVVSFKDQKQRSVILNLSDRTAAYTANYLSLIMSY